ncbi:MAG: hypothetical protein JKY27_01330 [Magnetovibrio sp.]|nr:hypothetical protein [Magnetovibrio sp.]
MLKSRLLFALATIFLLSACAGAPTDVPKSGPAVTPDTVDAAPLAPAAPVAPVAPVVIATPVVIAKPKITSQQLLGQGGAWVVAKLGTPVFRRADRTANIWRYKNGHCVLNVFLYEDENSASSQPRVLHFDARDAYGYNTDREHCLAALQE